MHMDSKCVNKDYASFMYEYLPQTFTSAHQIENYDSRDSVACGKTFTAIKIKILENLEFLNRKVFA